MVRPRIRADCIHGPRPCPWVGCRYHLYLDVTKTGRIITHADNPWDMIETCALDVAEDGATLRDIAMFLSVSFQRIQQVEISALQHLRIPCIDYGLDEIYEISVCSTWDRLDLEAPGSIDLPEIKTEIRSGRWSWGWSGGNR